MPDAPPASWTPAGFRLSIPFRILAVFRESITLDARSLALFRMMLGAILVGDTITRAPLARVMMAPDGMLPPDLVRPFVGHPWSWSVALWWDQTWWNLIVLAVEGISGALLAVGVATPTMTLLAWVAVVSVVRRTAPATNAGDVLLACLLFWGLFLPLGRVWSWDARRAEEKGTRWQVCGVATAALVVQVAAVYLSAGLSKCNEMWWSGDAVSYALSVHDHGTPLGDMIAARPAIARFLTWATLGLELGGPPLLLWPAARLPLVSAFVLFHAAILATMNVCLFPWVGMAAWLALLPGRFWGLAPSARADRPSEAPVGMPQVPQWGAAIGLVVAATAFFATNGPGRGHPLPSAAIHAIQATFLEQDWSVFGDIRRQRQWVYGRAELADGSIVDLLRNGRPLEQTLPSGGYHSLHNQRLQKLLWELPKPAQRLFAVTIAATLAREWNATHPPQRRVQSLEIHGGRVMDHPEPGAMQDVLLAAWPPRSATGGGALERFLRDQETAAPATSPGGIEE